MVKDELIPSFEARALFILIIFFPATSTVMYSFKLNLVVFVNVHHLFESVKSTNQKHKA